MTVFSRNSNNWRRYREAYSMAFLVLRTASYTYKQTQHTNRYTKHIRTVNIQKELCLLKEKEKWTSFDGFIKALLTISKGRGCKGVWLSACDKKQERIVPEKRIIYTDVMDDKQQRWFLSYVRLSIAWRCVIDNETTDAITNFLANVFKRKRRISSDEYCDCAAKK